MATRMPVYMGERTVGESIMNKRTIVEVERDGKKEKVIYESLAAAVQVFEKETKITSMDAMFFDGSLNYKMTR